MREKLFKVFTGVASDYLQVVENLEKIAEKACMQNYTPIGGVSICFDGIKYIAAQAMVHSALGDFKQ